MDENNEETLVPIEPTKSVPADIPSADPIFVENEYKQVIEGGIVSMHQAAATSITADEVEMEQSAAFIVRAEEVTADGSVAFILAAGEVRGNVTTLFTPATAAIIGGALIIGMLFLRPRR